MGEKRGQNMTLGTIILIILGLVVLVFLIIGFRNGFGFLGDILDKAPNDLDQARLACSQYEGETFALSFCEFREIKIQDTGVEGFYNCPGVWKAAEVVKNGSADFNRGSCGEGHPGYGADEYCKRLKANDENEWADIVVNGEKCGFWIGSSGGETAPSSDAQST